MTGMQCFACRERPAGRGALCGACAQGLSRGAGLSDVQVRSRSDAPATCWLADAYGRLHPVSAATTLGRHRTDIAVADVSVSREHVHLVSTEGGYCIRDLGSRNGTFINDIPVVGEAAVRPGERIRIGRTTFLFLVGQPDADALDEAGTTTMTTCRTERRRTYTLRVPDVVRVLLLDARDGGSGMLMEGQSHVLLSLLQLAFVERLVQRTCDDAELPARVRGFVSSTTLLEWLPWDAELPDVGHLKQLVRRTKLLLEGTRVTIEGARGLGYRLWSSGVTPAE